MAYLLRDPFHRIKKKISNGINSLWPRADFEQSVEVIHHKSRPNDMDHSQIILPEQAQQWMQEWKETENKEIVYKVKHPCTVDPKMGIIFMNGRVVWGSSDLPARERNPAFLSHLLPSAQKIQSAILLHHFYGDNYFHFFMYIVCKAILADKAGLDKDIPFLIAEKTARTRFFKEAVALNLFGKRKILIQKSKSVFHVQKTYLIREFFCDKEYLDTICQRCDVKNNAGEKKNLLIVRKKTAANGRMFRNQAAVNHLVSQYGFVTIDPGEMPLEDQIACFRQASFIIAPHGAGLTNIIFCENSQCKIIELFSPEMGSPHYFMLAKEKGFAYRSMITNNPQGRSFTASTEVDIDALKNLIEALNNNENQI